MLFKKLKARQEIEQKKKRLRNLRLFPNSVTLNYDPQDELDKINKLKSIEKDISEEIMEDERKKMNLKELKLANLRDRLVQL